MAVQAQPSPSPALDPASTGSQQPILDRPGGLFGTLLTWPPTTHAQTPVDPEEASREMPAELPAISSPRSSSRLPVPNGGFVGYGDRSASWDTTRRAREPYPVPNTTVQTQHTKPRLYASTSAVDPGIQRTALR